MTNFDIFDFLSVANSRIFEMKVAFWSIFIVVTLRRDQQCCAWYHFVIYRFEAMELYPKPI